MGTLLMKFFCPCVENDPTQKVRSTEDLRKFRPNLSFDTNLKRYENKCSGIINPKLMTECFK
jgi:hypothetical protein